MISDGSAQQEVKSTKLTPLTLAEDGRNRLIPALLTVIVVLPTVTEAKFRGRSALDALAGSIDLQILFELAVWTLGIGYVFVSLRREISDLRPPSTAGGKYVAALAALILLGTAWATPSALTTTRGLQTVLVLVAVLSVTPLTGRTISDLILRCATWFSFVVAGLFVLTVALPTTSLFTGSSLSDSSYFGIRRFKFLEIHSIPTANLLVLAIVLNTWVLLGGEFSKTHKAQRFRILWIALLATGLLLTRSRGALVGCVVATLVLVIAVLSSTEKRRLKLMLRFSALGLGALIMLFGGYVVDFMLRGESTQTILTLNSRTYLLEAMINLWQEEFWFGYGHLSGRSALLDTFAWAGESHNLVGEAMLSYGLVGLALVLVGLVGSCIRAIGLLRRSRFGPLFVALLAVIGSQAVVADSFLGSPGFEFSAFLLLILVGWERIESRDQAGRIVASRDDPTLNAETPRLRRP